MQLSKKGPALSMVYQAYVKSRHVLPGEEEWHALLLSCVASHQRTFIHLDALDECLEDNDVRRMLLDNIERLLKHAPNLQILATSRDAPDIRDFVEKSNAESMLIAARTVDADIRNYISTQILLDRKLSQLDAATTKLVEDTLSHKADGM